MIYRDESLEQITRLFAMIDAATTRFADVAKLNCTPGCGQCCEYPNIQVPVADCLVLASYLVETGEAEAWLAKLSDVSEVSTCCPFLASHGHGMGRCTVYRARPSLCRLFGYSATLGKEGKPAMVMCHQLKAHPSFNTEADASASAETMKAPMLGDWTRQVMAAAPQFKGEIFPIKKAVRLAIEALLAKASYTK